MTPNNPPVAMTPSHSIVDAIRGPVMLTALGLLMAADQMDRIGIERSWPALLILFGILKVAAYLAGGSRS